MNFAESNNFNWSKDTISEESKRPPKFLRWQRTLTGPLYKKKVTKKANKQIKILTPLMAREIQIQITMKCYCIPLRIAK